MARTKIKKTSELVVIGGQATADQLIEFLSQCPEDATVRVRSNDPDRPGELATTTYTVETEVVAE